MKNLQEKISTPDNWEEHICKLICDRDENN